MKIIILDKEKKTKDVFEKFWLFAIQIKNIRIGISLEALWID